MFFFDYEFSKNPLEQKSFEELSYLDQFYIVANDEVAEPIVEKAQNVVDSTTRTMNYIAMAIGIIGWTIFLTRKKGGK